MSLTWARVAAWRTRAHSLDVRRPAADALDVVSELCGLHAQLTSSAAATLHARVEGLPADYVERALWEDRTLVKTWCMRGTLHLLRSDEYALWQAGFGTYRHYTKPVWHRGFKITAEELQALLDGVSEALEGRVLTRAELADEVAARTSEHIGEKLRESWGAYLKPASFQGRLVFGPGEGQLVRFTRPDTWIEVGPPPADPVRRSPCGGGACRAWRRGRSSRAGGASARRRRVGCSRRWASGSRGWTSRACRTGRGRIS
ncbi:hypothetical protein SUDANB95_00912 [Actinosynnema sp. ALI-1.44]